MDRLTCTALKCTALHAQHLHDATCPALAQCCMYSTQTALRTQLLYSTMPCTATRWTELHVHHWMGRVTCTALDKHSYTHGITWTELHAQQLVGQHCVYSQHCMYITRWTELHPRQLDALHAQHCLHSTTSRTALLAQHHVMHSATCTALHA